MYRNDVRKFGLTRYGWGNRNGRLDSDLAISLVFGGCLIGIGAVGEHEGLQAGVCILAFWHFVGRERSDSCERRRLEYKYI